MDQIAAALNAWWNGVLSILTVLLSPDWSAIVAWVPLLLVVGVLGPILTLVAVGWVHHLVHARHGHVRYQEADPWAPERLADGTPVAQGTIAGMGVRRGR